MAITDNMVSYWACDEARGTRNDLHDHWNLTDNNTVGTGVGHVYTVAASFNKNSNEYLSRNNNVALANTCAISAWFKTASVPSAGSTYPIVSKSSDNVGMALFVKTSTLNFTIKNGIGVSVPFSSGHFNQWNHALGWFDDATNSIHLALNNIYSGGSYASVGNISGNTLSTGVPIYIGRQTSGSGNNTYFDGLIGPVIVWNSPAVSGEILTLWNNGAGWQYN